MTDPSPTIERLERARPSEGVAFERTISPVSGRLGAARGGKIIVLASLLAGCGVFIAATSGHGAPKAQARALDRPRQVVPFEPLKVSGAPTLDHPGPDAPALKPASDTYVPGLQAASGPANSEADQAHRMASIRGAPLLAYTANVVRPDPDSLDTPPRAAAEAGTPKTELDQLRRGSQLGRVRATRLPDRNFLILAGTAIPCILQTAMDTAAPGYVSCLLARDVFSDTGAVVLMEKGTRVLGEYRSGLRQGQRRLFVLWTRAVTPDGVAIDLASPAADGLGRAGFDGDINAHFWDRFGGALLMSIVDGAGSAVTSRGGDLQRLSSDAPGVALRSSSGIPASLAKRQGAEVAIFAAQDFDFSSVYGLKAR